MEELEHVSILRRERRQAFHAQRNASGAVEMTASAAELAAEERRLAELIEQDRTAFPNSELKQTIVEASRDAASKLDKIEARHHPTLSLPRLSADLRNDPLAVSELLVEAYLILADTAKNAKVLKVAQDLAHAALYRLARLRAASGMEPES